MLRNYPIRTSYLTLIAQRPKQHQTQAPLRGRCTSTQGSNRPRDAGQIAPISPSSPILMACGSALWGLLRYPRERTVGPPITP